MNAHDLAQIACDTSRADRFMARLALEGLGHRGYTVAVDFDGTLCVNSFPGIGEPKASILELVALLQACGVKTILWTCREGKRLEEASDWCREQGLRFDAVNENIPELKAKWGNDPRKLGANEFWDDRAVRIGSLSRIVDVFRDDKHGGK